jgi:hypothetical protein
MGGCKFFAESTFLLRLISICAIFAAAGGAASAAESITETICGYIDRSAQINDLPAAFLTRLIWSESSFSATAVSPAGAQGIAQFMPGTATERGLANPFDPQQAIGKSAEFLADLVKQFGNLGLAAAAYNAGPGRVSTWLAKKGDLPDETRAYVYRVTGRSADDWAAGKTAASQASKIGPQSISCLAAARLIRAEPNRQPSVIFAPWGAQLAAGFSRGASLAAFLRNLSRFRRLVGEIQPMIIGSRLLSRGYAPFYRIRIPEPTRAAADHACQQIVSGGGACVALRS